MASGAWKSRFEVQPLLHTDGVVLRELGHSVMAQFPHLNESQVFNSCEGRGMTITRQKRFANG
jgi:hypothetical protein